MQILTFYDISNIQLMSRTLDSSVAQVEQDLSHNQFLIPAAATHAYIQDTDNPHLNKIVLFGSPRY